MQIHYWRFLLLFSFFILEITFMYVNFQYTSNKGESYINTEKNVHKSCWGTVTRSWKAMELLIHEEEWEKFSVPHTNCICNGLEVWKFCMWTTVVEDTQHPLLSVLVFDFDRLENGARLLWLFSQQSLLSVLCWMVTIYNHCSWLLGCAIASVDTMAFHSLGVRFICMRVYSCSFFYILYSPCFQNMCRAGL